MSIQIFLEWASGRLGEDSGRTRGGVGGVRAKKIKRRKFPEGVREPPGTTGGHRGALPEPQNVETQHVKNAIKNTFSNFLLIFGK